jgi:squalene-hopene/tetraprenyl-beta-curcumene cyclase
MRATILGSCILVTAFTAFGASWDPKLAAAYLDSRQKAWSEWKAAAAKGGACFSCHTGMTYLLTRPALRRALGETSPTPYETQLIGGLRARLEDRIPAEFSKSSKEPFASQALGVEAIFAALFLASDNGPNGTLSTDAKQAFDRLWSLQIPDGKAKGSWAWFSLKLDPWEEPDSAFYGATLAALAVGSAPAEYRNQPEVREHVAALVEYLRRERASQPLHNRLMLLWASSKLPDALPRADKQAVVDDIFAKQQADGGWTIASLGPWKERTGAPPSSGSNSYATGLAAFALEQAGIGRTDEKLAHALVWLRSHQDREGGFWAADSMNKQYEPESMPRLFMRDAATAFASMALLQGADAGPERR